MTVFNNDVTEFVLFSCSSSKSTEYVYHAVFYCNFANGIRFAQFPKLANNKRPPK